MRAVCIFFATLALTSGGPITEDLKAGLLTDPLQRNSALENLILNIFEDIRAIIINGNDDIPVLDPLNIDYILVDNQILPIPDAHVLVTGLAVSKLSTFVVNTVSVDMVSLLLQRYRVVLDVSIPVLDVTVDTYDLSMTVFGGYIFGNGDLKINIFESGIQANLLVAPSFRIGAIYLNLLECEIKFNLKSFEPEITGLFNDAAASSFVNTFLKNLVSEMLHFFEDDITRILSTTVHDIARDILSDLNLIDLLG